MQALQELRLGGALSVNDRGPLKRSPRSRGLSARTSFCREATYVIIYHREMHLKCRKHRREVPKYRVANARLRLEDGRRVLRRGFRAAAHARLVEQGVAEPEFHWRFSIVHALVLRAIHTHIADLGGITTSEIAISGLRAAFWARATEKLHRLANRLTRGEREKIEAALSAKVPYEEAPPTSPPTIEDIEQQIQILSWRYQ